MLDEDESDRHLTSDIQPLTSNMFSRLKTFIADRRPERTAFQSWFGAGVAFLIVVGGVATAGLTLYARRVNDADLGFVAAIASLVFVVLMGVFVVPPLARAARGEVRRLDLPLRVTWSGFAVILVTGVVAAAAWVTGNNVLFLAFSLLLSMLFVSWMSARAVVRDVALTVRFPDYIFAGEDVPVTVTIDNRKWLVPSVSVFVEMRARVPKNLKKLIAYFMYTPRRTPCKETFNVSFARRGQVVVNSFDLTSDFPFGLFRVRRRLRTRDLTLTILPQLQSIDDVMIFMRATQTRGDAFTTTRGEGTELYGLRRYMPHDDRRRIAWKATARANRLMVREHLIEDEPRISVWLDTTLYVDLKAEELDKNRNSAQPSAQVSDERFERAVSIAASLVSHYANQNAMITLRSETADNRYDGGAAYRDELLRRLALVQATEDDSPHHADFWIDAQSSVMRDEQRFIITTAPAARIPPDVWEEANVIQIQD
ncbi:MAG: DUF58 domain-containing protein [Pyrinomonadaceae bacterium MAG19_C2-C3]|nr:DUF58 domain-containing protein [Pyrinomonadaceae bacterium MAG19_C2-C3]